jgi:polar amino acid transport system substrate-binding protein
MAHAFLKVRATLGSGMRVALLATALLAGGGASNVILAQDTNADVAADLGDDGVLTNCIDPAFPPMEYYEDQNADEPIGFDIDLTNALAERLGVKAEFVPMEFTGLLPGLQAGRCDIVASGIYITPERAATFGAQPYFDSSIILMTLADNDDISSPEDLSGKTVAVQSGTNYLKMIEALDQQLKSEGKDGINIQPYPKQTDADQQLVVGRADATITQDTEAAFRETAQPGQFKIAYTYPDAQTFAIYYNKDATALGGALRDAIEGMRDDGSLAKIATTWNLPPEGANYTNELAGATPAASPEATPAS